MGGSSVIPGPDADDPGPSDSGLAQDLVFVGLLSGSYLRLLKESLAPADLEPMAAARWLYEEAPFCLLAHNTSPDPRFVYANRAAQTCFGYSWDEMTRLSSRLSAEAPNRAERQHLVEAVTLDGFATGYRGLRIAKSGRRFWIEDVTMWQVTDDAGAVLGQAATYRRWRDA
jgi:PAS domain S-box-containing protein